MRTYRLAFLSFCMGSLLLACLSDTGSNNNRSDAGTDASGTSSGGDGGSSSSSSSSGSSGDGGGNPELPNLGCSIAQGHAVLHLSASSAEADTDGQVQRWKNLSGPEVGQRTGTVGGIRKLDVGGKPAVVFENLRAGETAPIPEMRIRFNSMGRVVDGAFALFVVGGHDAGFDPPFDGSSVGITYLFSGSANSRLQLMGRYHRPTQDDFAGFGALFFSGTSLSDHVGVYADAEVNGGMHIFEVVDSEVAAGQYKATLVIDGSAQPETSHGPERKPSTNTTIFLGGSDRPDQMLAGRLSEVVLLSAPTAQEVDCVRKNLHQKYGK